MRNLKRNLLIAVAALMIGGAGYRQYALAQGGGMPGGQMMGPPDFNSTSLAVSGDKVIVVRGSNIYRLNGSTLAVEAKAALPATTTTKTTNANANSERKVFPDSPDNSSAPSSNN